MAGSEGGGKAQLETTHGEEDPPDANMSNATSGFRCPAPFVDAAPFSMEGCELATEETERPLMALMTLV